MVSKNPNPPRAAHQLYVEIFDGDDEEEDDKTGIFSVSSDFSASRVGPGMHIAGSKTTPGLEIPLSLKREGKDAGKEERCLGGRDRCRCSGDDELSNIACIFLC